MERVIKISKLNQLHSIPTTAIKVSDVEVRFDFQSPNLIVFDLSSITAKKEGNIVNLYSSSVPLPLSKGVIFEQLHPWAEEIFNHSN